MEMQAVTDQQGAEVSGFLLEIVERLRDAASDLAVEAADEIERLMAEHDDYVIRANANVCELNREIERLRAHIDTLVQERDAERQTYNDAIARHLSEIKRLKAENKRLREDVEILRGATTFFAGELDPRNR